MRWMLCIFLFVMPCLSQGASAPQSPDDIKTEPSKCLHDTEDDFYANLTHSAPLQLINVNGHTALFTRMTKYELKRFEFHIEKLTRMPQTIYKMDSKKRFFALYCEKHQVVFVIEEIPRK